MVSVRPRSRERDRCPHCRRRCPGYDQGEGRRRWRALDLGTTFCFLEAWAPRVRCRRHGVVVAAVPWARHDSSFTRSFEDQVAWLAVHTSKTAVSDLMRIAWRSVGWICQRVAAEAKPSAICSRALSGSGLMRSRFARAEIPHGRGRPRHRHWCGAHPGRDRKTTETFLDLLGQERCQRIKLVSSDDAESIARPVTERCWNATVSGPVSHRQGRHRRLDKVRREVLERGSRPGPDPRSAREVKAPRSRCGRTPRSSPNASRSSSWRGSRSSTSGSTAPTSSADHPADLPCRRPPRTHAARRVAKWARRCRLEPSSTSPAGSPSSVTWSRRR